jgi:type IV pilus assembly protein PilM
MGTTKFYKDEPLFGLDIGHSSIKLMEMRSVPGHDPEVLGYGISSFDPYAIQNGIIVKPDTIANAVHQLFESNLIGNISSRRVACALPTAHTFSRTMRVPPMDNQSIDEAINLEAEQYVPLPIESLYLDYEISRQDAQGMELLLVATPKKIVDSYLALLESLGLEPVAFEPSINAVSRLLKLADSAVSNPSILVDIGAVTTDIAIFNKTIIVATTLNSGGDNITDLIAKGLHLTVPQATTLKHEHGIAYSEKQQRVVDAITPQLETLVHEIQKSQRYYSERATQDDKSQIAQVITVGGGALMPGLNQYLAKDLHLPVRDFEPWSKISFGKLQRPEPADLSMFLTVAGEAVLDPKGAVA